MQKDELSVPLCDDCAFERNAIFKHLTSDEKIQLNFKKEFRIYKRGDVLYREGNRISGIFCINDGIIKVFKTGLDGKEQIIRFAKKGEIIAYRSVLRNESACTSAEVIADSRVCFIPSEIFITLIRSNSTLALELIRLACHELNEANSYITDIAQKTVRERLAEVLVKLYNEFGADDQLFLKITLTREELANMVGTATESAIRLLSEFRNDKYIELKARRIKILNIDALEKVSNLY
jgi:CRP-like cAMP-binding protein